MNGQPCWISSEIADHVLTARNLSFILSKNDWQMSVFYLWSFLRLYINLLVIWQKDESQNGCFKKTKYAKFSEKRTLRTCAYQGFKKYSFFGKFGMLCFLETRVLRFALLPYYLTLWFRLLNKNESARVLKPQSTSV